MHKENIHAQLMLSCLFEQETMVDLFICIGLVFAKGIKVLSH